MPLVSFVLEAFLGPSDNTIQYADCFVIALLRAQSSPDLHLKAPLDSIPESIQLLRLGQDGEVVSMYHRSDIASFMPEYAGG